MPENVEAWWARRQRSKGLVVPYERGAFREQWAPYPMLVRQYHPEFNHGITLSQIPPAAEVYLLWQCDAGHLFVATPGEQRARPGGRRRRSVWCPVCAELANPRPVALAPAPAVPAPSPAPTPKRAPPLVSPRRASSPRREAMALRSAGTPFRSVQAPAPASAVEAELRRRLAERIALPIELSHPEVCTAVAVARPFHGRYEVWPDIVLADLRVAIEFDTAGRFGLEHVGPREQSDRRKDGLLRSAGWEVVRVRCAPLRALGPYDIETPGLNRAVLPRLVDALRAIRGELFVDAYLR